MSPISIPLETFAENFGGTTELSSVALGGKVVAVSDEFFAEAFHLLLVEPAPSLKGQFGPKGALYSGWESRRHNSSHDWCIIRLGTSGTILGFDIDTSHFNGNEAPQVSVEALTAGQNEAPTRDDPRWTEILGKVELGPNSRHLFQIPATTEVNFVKLNMYPDGGIARFRVYGHVSAIHPTDVTEIFDLAHVFAGGRVVHTSDQHFGVGSNLILPGRGKDMGDGWETKRSRLPGHSDWAIIKLGAPGYLQHVEIDTAHFKGNFPESLEIHALKSTAEPIWSAAGGSDQDWRLVLPRTKLGPHRQHYFQLEDVDSEAYTHIRVTIHPDGGIKRVRVMGRLGGSSKKAVDVAGEEEEQEEEEQEEEEEKILLVQATPVPTVKVTDVPVLPLTPEAFGPFGQVIQSYEDLDAVPKGTKVTPANAGTASKFHKLSLLDASYPTGSGESAGISVYRCQPVVMTNGKLPLTVLERHAFTNQSFIPMGRRASERGAYLVVVAWNGADDRPDLGSLRAFVARSDQGITYNKNIWHQPMTVLDEALDFGCIETQIGNGGAADCEIVDVAGRVRLVM